MGPVLLLAGIVGVLLGGAGLLASGGASFSRLHTTKPIVYVLQVAFGVLFIASGARIILGT